MFINLFIYWKKIYAAAESSHKLQLKSILIGTACLPIEYTFVPLYYNFGPMHIIASICFTLYVNIQTAVEILT